MRIMYKQGLLVCAALTLLAGSAHAGKRAFVNMETIFEGYYKTIRANAAFEQKKADFEERIDILRDELRAMVSDSRKLEEQASNDLLSEEAREESKRKLKLRLERLRAKEEEFRQYRGAGFKELQKSRLAAEEELIEDLAEFVRKYCREKGLDLVYDVTGKSLNRMPVLMVYPEEEEITAEILKAINLGHEDELEKAKADLEAMEKARSGKRDEGEGEKTKDAAKEE